MVPSSGDGHEPKEETSNDKKKEPKKFEVDGEQVLPEGERKKKKPYNRNVFMQHVSSLLSVQACFHLCFLREISTASRTLGAWKEIRLLLVGY